MERIAQAISRLTDRIEAMENEQVRFNNQVAETIKNMSLRAAKQGEFNIKQTEANRKITEILDSLITE